MSEASNHPWPVYSYATVYNDYHSRNGETGRIISAQKSHRSPNSPWEYKLEFSDLHQFWILSTSLELIKPARFPMIPGED